MLVFDEDHPFALAYRLVQEGKLNPWHVDIVELANIYLEEIKKMEVLDMRVPARAVLAAAFLLKKKVEVLLPEPKKPRERKKHFTLDEILQEFEEQEEHISESIVEIVKSERITVRKKASVRRERGKIIPIHISRFEYVLEEIDRLISEGLRRFSLLELFWGRNLAPYVMAIMVLYGEGKVDIYQKEPYGDLVIEVLEDGQEDGG